MKYAALELFEILNDQDECPWIEAKGGSESSHSVMETVCSFSNEQGLRGGYILLGVAMDPIALFSQYKTYRHIAGIGLNKESNIIDSEANTGGSTQHPKISTQPPEISTSPRGLSTLPPSISTKTYRYQKKLTFKD